VSEVTDILLLSSHELMSTELDAANAFFGVEGLGLSRVDEFTFGGDKVMQGSVAAGAFNHIDAHAFIQHCLAIKWDKQFTFVQLAIQTEFPPWIRLGHGAPRFGLSSVAA